MIFTKKGCSFYILITTLLIVVSYLYIDKNIAHYFIAHKAVYEPIGDIISILGESHWYIGTGVLGALYFKFYKPNRLYMSRFLFLLYSSIFSGLISILLKWTFGRVRPWGLRNDGDYYGFTLFRDFDMGFIASIKEHFITIAAAPTTHTSFPSGHTTTLFSAFTVLTILFPKYLYLWLTLAIFAASSRILANDHFLSDLLAGSMVGVCATLFIYYKMRANLEKIS
ncbi:phosphatase PAP2 family protein [Sulfurimonas sp.]